MITTPTPLPPGVPHVSLGDNFSIWAGTDAAIQTWNWIGGWGQTLQLFIIIVIILAGLFVVFRFVRQFTQRDAES